MAFILGETALLRSKQGQLIRLLGACDGASAFESHRQFELLVRDGEDMHAPGVREATAHLLNERRRLIPTGTKPQVYGKLRHLEAMIEQVVTKASCRFALRLASDR